MKRLLAILICLVLVFSIGTATVGAATNYCSLFEDNIRSLRWPMSDAGDPTVTEGTAFPTEVIMEYAKMELGNSYYTDGEQYMKVPGAVLENWAKKNFAIVDINTLRSYSVNDGDGPDALKWIYYDTATSTYMFLAAGGKGDSTTYKVLGYLKNGSKYTVYSAFIDQAGDEIPAGAVEGKDYLINKFEDTETKCLIIHALKTVVETDGTDVKFHSWEKLSSVPTVSGLITPDTIVKDESTVSSTPSTTQSTPASTVSSTVSTVSSAESVVSNETSSVAEEKPLVTVAKTETATLETEENVFPEDTVVKVEEIKQEETIKTIETALETVAEKFVAYEITAECNNISVQPNGKVKATFNIPTGYDLDRVAVFYIADNGTNEKLSSKVDKTSNTVVAELSHFSTYVVAETKSDDTLSDDTALTDDNTDKSSGGFIWIIITVIAVLLIGGAACYFVFKNKAKKS